MFSVKGIKFIFEHAHFSANGKKRNPDVAANESAILYPAMGLYVAVVCEASYIGSEEQMLVLQFNGFCIGQRLSVNVTDPHQLYIEPVPSNSYEGNRSETFQRARSGKNVGWVVPGQRPINRFRGRFQLPQRLPQFPVPDELRDCVFDQGELTEVRPHLQQELSMDCYTGKFHTLLHLEEIQMDIDIRQFDLEQVCLRRVGEFLCLGVPDLAEGRPSLLIGDKVILSEPGCMDGLSYAGYIHEVLSEEVLVKFHGSFHQNFQGESYDVVFTFNRSTIRRCHQAVDMALQLSEQVLFPEEVVPKLPQWIPQCRESEMVMPVNRTPAPGSQGLRKLKSGPLELFNTCLNQRQQEAVIRIVLGQGRPTPYILFGPPGTGKTVTVVESILQIFMKVPHSRIIACTPSNSAADLLTERLQQSEQLTTADMVRINALQRTEESIPDSIRPYCYDDTNLQMVSHYRIIVCTCASAGMLLSLGIKVGHFTHVFVDEAGQATEPECLIPISLIGQSDGQIVLAGDPHQLGPVLASKFAKSHGLELSLLERLTLMPVYRRDVSRFQHGYNPLLVTKLVDNYRSHESLLRLPSRLFYHDELCVKADPELTHSFTDWSNLPMKGCPLIFHGVRGEDMRDGNSPSWFNPAETVQVIQYVQMLLHEEPHRIAPEEIGIITAYRKQVEKIRLLMEKLGIPKIKVGSVEEFQGQERKAVIISTVRSTENLLRFDVRHNLGFLSNPKRFNVSITRAQALLIVIGNPFVLSQDPYWEPLIGYSVESGAYTGCDPPDDHNNNNN
ncbi:LOW QUALITY PROTEIN: RNA helicase Mov10l1-like [Liolophura sinensis]|uniref:LOW QUALITY PROTEIN: RNA helicase Mov10l1-like n=1 Tax=Liolophura sinensis TaxID=3198878 RepID=UPI003158F095